MNFADVKSWIIPEGEVIQVVDSQNRVIWKKPIDYTEPFYVENVNESNAVTITKSNSYAPTLTIEYSYDKTNWDTLGTTDNGCSIRVNKGDKVYLRCNATAWGVTNSGYNRINGMDTVGGNIMSLLYGNNFNGQTEFSDSTTSIFYNIFRYSSSSRLVNASKLLLPATILTQYCYEGMFYDCSSLAQAPALPATTLANYCYRDMFRGCTSLITAPALPATTLAEYCYVRMFYDCSSLAQAPALPATTLANSCYSNMFAGCASLTQAPELPVIILANSCYSYMFYNCTSLTQAPDLPATTLVSSCYSYMFYGCTALTKAPDLLATTMVSSCYSYMFYNCTVLNEIKCLATNPSSANPNRYTHSWIHGVSSTGTFTKPTGVTWPTDSATLTNGSGIPSDWTVVEV